MKLGETELNQRDKINNATLEKTSYNNHTDISCILKDKLDTKLSEFLCKSPNLDRIISVENLNPDSWLLFAMFCI